MNDSVSELADATADLKKARRPAQRFDDPLKADHFQPHDEHAEKAVIGCQLSPRRDSVSVVMEKSRGDAEIFYDLRHQEIQKVIFNLSNAGKAVDLISVQSWLKDSNQLEQVGGIHYLSELQDAAEFMEHNLEGWVDTVLEKHLLRKAIKLCSDTVGKIYGSQGDVSGTIDELERSVMALRTMRGNDSCRPIKAVVLDALADIESMFERKGQISGISTGIADLDVNTDGLHPAEFILIAAFPSVGKTSLAMNIVEHVTLELGLPVGVFSAEMSSVALVKRAISSVGRVNLREIRRGRMVESDFPKITTAAARIGNAKLHIDDTSDMTIGQVRAKARRMVQQFGVKLFVADFAQLFSSPGAENRTNEVDQVSKGFKNMAKELNVPVVLLSQLTEDAKGNIHLKGARALGEDADGYWQLKRPKGAIDDPESMSEPIELWLKKQRNEARGVCINLTFLKPYTKFEGVSKINDADVPNYAGR